MSPTSNDVKPPRRDVLALRLAWLALSIPLVVILLVTLHTLWFTLTNPLALASNIGEQAALLHSTMTPAGVKPRFGPGSHPAIDLRHSPFTLSDDARRSARPIPAQR